MFSGDLSGKSGLADLAGPQDGNGRTPTKSLSNQMGGDAQKHPCILNVAYSICKETIGESLTYVDQILGADIDERYAGAENKPG